MGDRNEKIQKSIEEDKVPLLPFELVVATNAMSVHIDKQSELGKMLGEMMQQSSETWHDNAPAEAVAHDAKILAISAESTMRIIRNAEVFGYENDDNKVSLGSLVEAKYEGDDETSLFILTGVTREFPEGVVDETIDTSEIQCATISSPVGSALFDKSKGDVVEFRANGRTIKMEIVDVRKLSN